MKKNFVMRLMVVVLTAAASGVAATPADPYGLLLKPIPDKTVVLSFDDGCKSDVAFVAPLLKKHGFNATFYITGADWFNARKDRFMTWAEIKSIEDMGFEIGNHTVHHWGLSAHSVKNCIMTTEGMEERFKTEGVGAADTFCWPLYAVNKAFVPVLAEKGYRFARGGGERAYDPMRDSPMNVPSFTLHDRALDKDPDAFIKQAQMAKDGKIAVFCLHGVPDLEHPGVSLKPERFAEMMTYLKENDYHVISMRDLGTYIDAQKALLYLNRAEVYPWGGRALSWGWVSRKEDMLYLGIAELPEDRKLTLPNMTTQIAKAWLLGDAEKKPLDISVSDKGVSTITVPRIEGSGYGSSPVLVAAKLKGGPRPVILDFVIPGLPKAGFDGDAITVRAPMVAKLDLTPIYRTGSDKVTGVPASGTISDFSKPRQYIIKSPGGETKAYTVRIIREMGAAGFANPGFESFDLNGGADSPWAWTFKPTHRGATVRLLSVEDPQMPSPPPDGSRHCAVIGGKGSSISQSVILDEGTYTISFDRTIPYRVPAATHPSIHLVVDGEKVMTVDAIQGQGGRSKTQWKRHTSPPFAVEAGAHTIQFVVGDDASPSNYNVRETNLIDNVQIAVQSKPGAGNGE